MKIAKVEKEGVVCLKIDGRLDAKTASEAEATVKEVLKEGRQQLLFDLSGMDYISSAGLRALHHIFNALRARDVDNPKSEEEVRRGISSGTYKSPHLKLLKLSKESKTAFDLSGFDMFIDTFDDEQTAIASF